MHDENNTRLSTVENLIRCIIIEDDNCMRKDWTNILDEDPEVSVLSFYGSCEEALEKASFEYIDVILLDIQLSERSSVEGIKEFMKIDSDLSIIMTSVLESSDSVFTSFQNGAIGYLRKDISPSDLVRAVKIAYDGGSPISPKIARKVVDSLNSVPNADKELKLNDREEQILQLLAEGRSYLEMADLIFLSVDGVGYHIRNLYSKMQVNNRAEAVARGITRGLIDID